MTSYGTLRSWAAFLTLIGAVFVVAAIVGTIMAAIDADGVLRTVAVLLIGLPVSIFLATLPVALAQMMRAVADVGDVVRGT